MNKIDAAETKIAGILAQLEFETGQLVEHIRVDDIEVTTIGDTRPQLSRRVFITLRRVPGSNWSK